MSVRARKRYGQHFLNDPSVIAKIIEAIDFNTTGNIVEIGPGRGALTRPLLEQTDLLHVVEIDNDLVEHLRDIENSQKLKIHHIDALDFDFCKSVGNNLTIIGNLPYNISTPLLFHLLDQINCISNMLFMLQKEVAERICASPGNKDYGRLSIMVQCMCNAYSLFDVQPEAFTPIPKVQSTIIKLVPANNPEFIPDSVDTFKRLVRQSFSKRRKTIRNALKGIVDDEILIASDIDPNTRPETIGVEGYIRLSNNLYNSAKVTNN